MNQRNPTTVNKIPMAICPGGGDVPVVVPNRNCPLYQLLKKNFFKVSELNVVAIYTHMHAK